MESNDPVSIQEYDPAWPSTFLRLAASIKAVLGNLVVTIEHIGSTAVPGLAAKPIIDIDVVLGSPSDLPQAIRLLATIGYVHEGDLGIAGRQAFGSPAGEPRHHLYVLAAGAGEMRRHLAFRDALRASEDLRNKYAELKRGLATTYKSDRGGYTEAKTAFIASTVSEGDPVHDATDAVAPLRARLSADLIMAMKLRDKATIDALRCLLAVLDNAGAQDPKLFGPSTEVPRKSLNQNELLPLMQEEITSRHHAIIEYERRGRTADAARLRLELIVLSRYVTP